MKIVIKIGDRLPGDAAALDKCASAFAELTKNGHQLVAVHGCRTVPDPVAPPAAEASRHETRDRSDFGTEAVLIAGAVNKIVIERFERRGLRAIGMCGSDCGIFHLRSSRNGVHHASACTHGIARVDPAWLDALCNLGITPVIAGVGLTPEREYRFTDPDMLASVLASRWNAHALIFLSSIAGVKDVNGNVMRWLDLRQVQELVQLIGENEGIWSKLQAARHALQSGVRRVRILPFIDAELLADFYVSRIDSGTEIFEGSPVAEIQGVGADKGSD